jgi:hypothetical protein
MTNKTIRPAGFFRKGLFGRRRQRKITAVYLGAGFYSENGIEHVRIRLKVRANFDDKDAVLALRSNDYALMKSVSIPLKTGDNYCEIRLLKAGFDRSMLAMGSRLRFFFCVRTGSGEVFRGAEFPISILELLIGAMTA